MKTLTRIRSKTAVAGLVLVLASAIPGSAALIQVPADYSTIQAAVNAANNGDTIQIGAGVYTNQVVVSNKNLTLSGSPGAVLRATPGMQQTLIPVAGSNATPVALVGIFKSTNVVVSGLTFEGERLAASQPGDLYAVSFMVAGGRVENCRITGFRPLTLGTTNSVWGCGVHVVNWQTPLVNVDVVGNTFADNTISIALVGDVGPNFNPGLLRTHFTVDDNTIIGNGPDANGRQFGIQIYAGAGGNVKRNTISDHAYIGTTDPIPFSFGILASDNIDFERGLPLAALQPILFEGNILRSNQDDLVLERGDGSTIVNNSFEGTAPGLRPTGLAFSGDGVVVATNRFSDMPLGILLFGDDPDSLNRYFGVASNATLIANGFCNVATNITVESPATIIEEGTLTNCPEPTLDVTRAVLLTWPYDIQGYAVESAPAIDGPWTTNSDATVFLQNGQNSVAIPADSNQQYFKLVKQP